MKLKTLKQGSSFPRDWWNYKVNPILGFEYKPRLNKKK
tara:strand:- start:311 stop:424 length:114 start_codon:yes stop_codon:yes gene_type:complete